MRLLLLILLVQAQIRIDVARVQVDAIVTDKSGKPVKDLTSDDFEIFADGISRPVSGATYIDTTTQTQSTQPRVQTGARLQPNQVTRTIAFLVDDLKMGIESVHRTRLSLHKYIDTQRAPGDLVAILSTSGGLSALQQFTADPRILHKAVDRLRVQLSTTAVNTDGDTGETAFLVQRRLAVGTMAAIRYISAGMRSMPGRKSLILLSDGILISKGQALKDPNTTVSEAREVTSSANRSAVVIYAIDTRGLLSPPFQAQDDYSSLEPEQVMELLNKKRTQFTDNQIGLSFLALETGGSTRFHSNDITDSLQSIMESQSGYYLLSFPPNEDKEKYARLLIRLKRPGLKIQYRKSALPEPDPRPANNLLTALSAPFSNTDIPLRILPIAQANPGKVTQWSLGAILHIDIARLEFSAPDSKGIQTATLQILSVTEGEAPISNAATEQTYTIRSTTKELPKLQADGLLYSLQSNALKPGPYQVRAAVRDPKTGKLGSTSAFIELPDNTRSQTVVSTLNMSDGTQLSQVLRSFRAGAPIAYSLTVYNPKLDGKTGNTIYDLQPRILHDEKVLWQGTPFPVKASTKEAIASGTFTLGPKSVPGEYLLQVLLIPRDGKSPTLTQWVDFEVRLP
ncbi:MAG: VWA domain-containing protein [Acidobacteria bacterium]|nr:VWA domain-containing protein [Acidobacteriota bacterium]